MGIFSPVKKHANKFRYTPRYYDPEKERRDLRRMELCGTSSHDDGEYVPGQYIRTQREARRLAKANSKNNRGRRPATLLLLLAGLTVAALVLYPRLVSYKAHKQANTSHLQDEMVVRKEQGKDVRETDINEYQQAWEEAAWPYRHTKITIVSNDSKEEY